MKIDRPSDAAGPSIPRIVAEDNGNGYIGDDGDFVDTVLFVGRAEKPSPPGGTQIREPEFATSALWRKGTVVKGHNR